MEPNKKPSTLYLAIDQGGHASRAFVFDQEGHLLAKGIKDVTVTHRHADWVEQDPEEVVASILTAVDQAGHMLGPGAEDITAVGLATQRSSVVCWDTRSGRALSPVISWQDRRAHVWLGQFSAQAEEIHKLTGLFLSPHYGASKLRWCLDYLPEVGVACKGGYLSFGPLASFLLFRLLLNRPLFIDPANASRTLLWNFKTCDWDPKLLELFGLPAACLPLCVPTRYAFGNMRIRAKPAPLRIVTGDQSAALYAYGQPQTKTAYINVGTGAFLQRPIGYYAAYHPKLLTSIVLHDNIEKNYVLEGTVNGAGSALTWLSQELNMEVEQKLPEWLAQASEPPLFLNGISGLGSPFWVPDFASRFIGEGEPWQKAVAVAESIVFLLQENLRESAYFASQVENIHISGGLARYDGLCQRLADLSALPVYRPGEHEATARGTVYLLAGCPEVWPEAARGIWFKPRENSALTARYQRWREALSQALAQ
jgi:glycerol kinase